MIMIKETLEIIEQDKKIEKYWDKKYSEILSRNRATYNGILLNREIIIHSTFLCYEYTYKGIFVLHSKDCLWFIGNKKSGYWQELSNIKDIKKNGLYEYVITKPDLKKYLNIEREVFNEDDLRRQNSCRVEDFLKPI